MSGMADDLTRRDASASISSRRPTVTRARPTIMVASLMLLAFSTGAARAATLVSPPSHWPCAALHYQGDAGGRLQRVTVDTVGVSVLLPTDYATAVPTRYPVLYLFHGYGASSDTWLLKTDLVNFTADQRLLATEVVL